MSETCEVCGRKKWITGLFSLGLCLRTLGSVECWRLGYERQRADALSEKQRADAAEAEIARLTKEAQEARADRDANHELARQSTALASKLKAERNAAEASAKALREALTATLGWAGHHDDKGMHWIASELFTSEDCPCAALAPPNTSPEKLTPTAAPIGPPGNVLAAKGGK